MQSKSIIWILSTPEVFRKLRKHLCYQYPLSKSENHQKINLHRLGWIWVGQQKEKEIQDNPAQLNNISQQHKKNPWRTEVYRRRCLELITVEIFVLLLESQW